MLSFLYSLKGLWFSLWMLCIVVCVYVGGLAENAKYYMLYGLAGILSSLIMYLMLYRYAKSLHNRYLRVRDIKYNILYGYVYIWYTPP